MVIIRIKYFAYTFLCVVASYDISNGKVEDQKKPLENSEKDDASRAALFASPRIFPISPIFNPLVPPQLPLVPALQQGLGGLGSFSSKPNCNTNGPFCLFDDDYPREMVNRIVGNNFDDVRNMYSSLHRIPFNDLLHHDNTTHKFREGGHFVCESQVQYIRPGWAKNIRGHWLAIINTEKFPQVVRTEECKYATRRCEYLPPCYKSTCVQRYSFEKLLCVDPQSPTGKPIVDVFEIPTACSCFVDNQGFY